MSHFESKTLTNIAAARVSVPAQLYICIYICAY